MADIFISYARADRDKIEKLAAILERQGFSVWWDRHIAGGAKFSKDIERELIAAKKVIVAWSAAAVESMWVADEAAVGLEGQKLIPIALDATMPPIGFRQLQTIAFQDWNGTHDCDAFQSLARCLGDQSTKAAPSPTKPQATSPTQSASGVSLLIMPFRTISADPADQVLTTALHEDLTTQLARVKDYFVISRTTALVLGARNLAPQEISRETGVTYVLEGSVRRGGDDVRVSAQLVDAISGGHIAALSFDRPASELLSLQNDLIAEIVNHLGSEINLAEVRRVDERAGADPTAVDFFNRARAALSQKGWNKRGVGQAIIHLEQAVEEDPNYAPAIGQLALLKGLAIVNKIFDEKLEAVKPEVLKMSKQAVALDHQSSDVLGFAGCALCDIGEVDEGTRYLERAVELDPSNAQAHAAFGWGRILQGRQEEGVALMNAAIRISPKQPGSAFWLFGMATGLQQLGKNEEAVATLEKAIRFDPTFAISYELLANIVEKQGNDRYAAQLRERVKKIRADYA